MITKVSTKFWTYRTRKSRKDIGLKSNHMILPQFIRMNLEVVCTNFETNLTFLIGHRTDFDPISWSSTHKSRINQTSSIRYRTDFNPMLIWLSLLPFYPFSVVQYQYYNIKRMSIIYFEFWYISRKSLEGDTRWDVFFCRRDKLVQFVVDTPRVHKCIPFKTE